jgi:hypothetical protein
MAYPKLHGAASKKYRPASIKLLFIAESPPALKSARFFYFASLNNGDTLFLEMMKVLYPIDTGFVQCSDEEKSNFEAKQVRQKKEKFLAKFSRDRFYLIDASEQPMPEDADAAAKVRIIRGALPQLRKKVRELCRRRDVPIILIGSPAYSVCAKALRKDGLRILNDEMINHPSRGGQKLFRRKLRKILYRFTIKTSDGTL